MSAPRRSRRTPGAVVAAALTALVAPLAIAGPAHAQTAERRDGRGDVWRYVQRDDSYVRSDRTTNVDVRRFRIAHRAETISFTATYGSLTRSEDVSLAVAQLFTSAEARYTARVYVGPDWRNGVAAVYDVADDGDSEVVACEGATASVSYRDDTVSGVFPRSCFGNPASVYWAGYTGLLVYDRRGDISRTFYEDVSSGRVSAREYESELDRG